VRILLIATKWDTGAGDPWLLDDLAGELVRTGHEVDVIVADPRSGRPVGVIPGTPPGMHAWSVGPRRRPSGRIGRVTAHLGTAWRLRTTARSILRGQTYDVGIYTSVATFNWSLPRWVRTAGIVQRLVLVLWDFFPVHQVQIGRLRRGPFSRVLKRLESRAIAPADSIALMSDANVRFFADYFGTPAASTMIVRPWASAPPPPSRARSGPLRVIFGGQLTAGRDLDTLLGAARILAERRVPVAMLIVGDGPALTDLRSRASGIDGVEVKGVLPREEYRALLRGCDVGIALTVAGTTVPTFPSKIVEYCSAGVAVVVASEEASDAGSLIEAAGAGLAIPSGSPTALADALEELGRRASSGELAAMGASARRLFDEELSVTRAAERLLAGG
jgi:glycosyltransferase involved in cell wall biosynthesis